MFQSIRPQCAYNSENKTAVGSVDREHVFHMTQTTISTFEVERTLGAMYLYPDTWVLDNPQTPSEATRRFMSEIDETFVFTGNVQPISVEDLERTLADLVAGWKALGTELFIVRD